MQTRENARHQWLKTIYPANDYSLVPLAGDASFRCYFRLFWHDHTRIVMDIPPDKLQLQPFIQIQTLLNNKGIITPYIHALENDLGFALLEDFGDMLFQSIPCCKSKITPPRSAQIYRYSIKLVCFKN